MYSFSIHLNCCKLTILFDMIRPEYGGCNKHFMKMHHTHWPRYIQRFKIHLQPLILSMSDYYQCHCIPVEFVMAFSKAASFNHLHLK